MIVVVAVLLLTGVFSGGSDKPEAGAEPEPVITVAPNLAETPKLSPTEEPDSAERSKSTPAPEQTPAPEPGASLDGLAGRWEFESGVRVWFFGMSDYIEFEVYGDGTGTVFESEEAESGTWFVDDDGYFIIEGDWSGTYTVELILSKDTLTIIDVDGDSIQYKRAG